MVSPVTSRAATAVLLALLLGSLARAGRRRIPCPHRKCQCRAAGGGIHVACTSVGEELPEFRDRNTTYATLEISDGNLSFLRAEAFREVPVRRLDLSGNQIGARGIESGAFTGLEDVLVFLSLSQCGLPEVPVTALRNLTSLQYLYLDSNSITRIEKKTFKMHEDLLELFLQSNRIEKIDQNAFAGLENLRDLKLYDNNLTELPKKLFRHLSNLTSLDISSNRLRRLSKSAFRGLSSLQVLELKGNMLSTLSKKVFTGLKSLKILSLLHNPLVRLEPGVFKPMPMMDYLAIDVSNVTDLPKKSFIGLKRLKMLRLDGVGVLPPGLLKPCRRLKHLTVYARPAGVPNQNRKEGPLSVKTFAKQAKFSRLSVFVEPIDTCNCSLAWVSSLTKKGAYVKGNCVSDGMSKPVQCLKRRTPKGPRRKGGGKKTKKSDRNNKKKNGN